jgi:hypothetical protein
MRLPALAFKLTNLGPPGFSLELRTPPLPAAHVEAGPPG